MPTVGIKRDLLFKALGQTYTEEQFQDLCFQFGLELDEVTSEKQMIKNEQGTDKCAGASEEEIYRIDIPANRYDLLCLEGLVRGLLIFQGKIEVPVYKTLKPKSGLQQLTVLPNTALVRPYVVAAILRNITFTQDIYNSFIDLQDKLHQNVCRKRSLVSIGTHDLDTVTGPFFYDAKPPKDIRFVPLNQTKEYATDDLMEHYSGDSHLKPYLPIIRDKPVYPVILDSKGTVLSFPPIVNSEHSKLTLKTKNVFIEITATDLHKASLVLDTLVCMFSEYCKDKFTVECVEVINSDGSHAIYPELKTRSEDVAVEKINKGLGINLSTEEVSNLLTKMGLKSAPRTNGLVNVTIPPTRQDILHACDVVEDVGIAYGYNNIPWTMPQAVTVGKQLSINKLTDQLRFEIARCGFSEALTFSLCSREDVADKMLKKNALSSAVHISNPKTFEFQVARTSLIPGLLKTLQSNKKMPLPLKIFEISDVVLKDAKKDVGARNERRLCALNYNKTPGFEIIHGLLDRIMQVLEVKYVDDASKEGDHYFIQPFDDESFLKGRCAQIVINKSVVGVLGVLHPEVLSNFELIMPCAVLELNIEGLGRL